MKRFVLSLIASVFCLCVSAQNYEQIHTKDGSIYEGYITKQLPGQSITVFSVKTTRMIPDENVASRKTVKKAYNTMPEAYREAFPSEEPATDVEVSTLILKSGAVYKSAIILESGLNLKVLTFDEGLTTLAWSDLAKTTRTPYVANAGKGLKDVIILSSTAERVEGQVIEQNIARGTLIFKDSAGNVLNLKNSDVTAIRVEVLDEEASFWSQVPLCDRLLLKNGSKLEGLIVAKQFGKSVTIKTSDDQKTLTLDKIAAYEKYLNPIYEAPVPEVVEEEPEEVVVLADVYVDGKPSAFVKAIASGSDFALPMPTDSIPSTVKVGEEIVIEFVATTRTSSIRFAKSNVEKEKLYSLRKFKIQKVRTAFWPVFSHNDVVNNVDIDFRYNDTSRIELGAIFSVAGTYILFVEGDMTKCIPIIVTEK